MAWEVSVCGPGITASFQVKQEIQKSVHLVQCLSVQLKTELLFDKHFWLWMLSFYSVLTRMLWTVVFMTVEVSANDVILITLFVWSLKYWWMLGQMSPWKHTDRTSFRLHFHLAHSLLSHLFSLEFPHVRGYYSLWEHFLLWRQRSIELIAVQGQMQRQSKPGSGLCAEPNPSRRGDETVSDIL